MKLIPNEVYLTNKNRRLKCIENIEGRDIVIMQDPWTYKVYYFNKKGEYGDEENIIDGEVSASCITYEVKGIKTPKICVESVREIAKQVLPSIIIAIPSMSAENAVKYSRIVAEAFLEEFKND